ncbi:hypothetical protein DSO57_1009797 [Entomophthora muscae]|uniref:Uncharacterized protein n=1 Tax=Entomophthora muscae TaxID=34485 RepID=A0ACC2RXU0_9FUNG|nr:hypothetical protein DSO57_1009797 [Entomophthora muscae]
MTKKQETNKSQEGVVSKPSQVQNVTISTSNQNTAVPTNFPGQPKMDLAGFRKGLIMINALFHAHPKSFKENTQKVIVNSLPPLALDRTLFPRRTKKTAPSPAKPLNSLNDLAHTVDERFVLAYPAGPPALVALTWEETLVNLNYLLAWNTQSNGATSTTTKPTRSEMLALPSSQSEGVAEITLEPSSPPGPGQQIFSSAQSNATLEAM